MNEFDLYRNMLKIRTLEDELQKLCMKGEAGDLHFSKGEEAIAVGVCSVLKPTDYSVTHHRSIAHAVARGVPLKDICLEVLRGKAGEMHMRFPNYGYQFSFQLVGTCIPVAAGIAWASKYVKKEDAITAVFFGDAATANGQFHEGLNIACVNKLPLLLVVENNHLAGNITPEYYQSFINVSKRFESFGIGTYKVDGNKLDEIIPATESAIRELKRFQKPIALVFDTTRMCNHKQGQRDTRTKEELDELAKRDPIKYMIEKYAIGGLEQAQAGALAYKEVKDALEFALASPFPTL